MWKDRACEAARGCVRACVRVSRPCAERAQPCRRRLCVRGRGAEAVRDCGMGCGGGGGQQGWLRVAACCSARRGTWAVQAPAVASSRGFVLRGAFTRLAQRACRRLRGAAQMTASCAPCKKERKTRRKTKKDAARVLRVVLRASCPPPLRHRHVLPFSASAAPTRPLPSATPTAARGYYPLKP
jgi:hypothetical protein